MRIELNGNTVQVKDADVVQMSVIGSWNKLRWDRRRQAMTGTADAELLDKLASLVRLPDKVEARRIRLHAVQDAVNYERMNPKPVPLYSYPVKMPLYAHQVRGANMCLLTFGWVAPKDDST